MGRELLVSGRVNQRAEWGEVLAIFLGQQVAWSPRPRGGRTEKKSGGPAGTWTPSVGLVVAQQTAVAPTRPCCECLQDPSVAQGCRVAEAMPEPLDVAEASGLASRCSVLCTHRASHEPRVFPDPGLCTGCLPAGYSSPTLTRSAPSPLSGPN